MLHKILKGAKMTEIRERTVKIYLNNKDTILEGGICKDGGRPFKHIVHYYDLRYLITIMEAGLQTNSI